MNAPDRSAAEARATGWRIAGRVLPCDEGPLLMGIVNVTPDSFSDGGRFLAPAAAIEHGLRLVDEGADILDIGGESTRPGADPIEANEELRRVLPVIEGLAQRTDCPLSVDTRKAAVAQAALAAGAQIVNDISGLEGDPAMLDVVAQSECGVCVMHMQGTPQTMQDAPHYDDVVGEVFDYLRRRRDAILSAGVAQVRIALDPGLGFGKTTEHNLALLKDIGRFHALGCPLLLGPSRKRFIGQLLGNLSADRTAGTIGAALALALGGVQILRLHDVAAVRQAMVLFKSVVDS